MSDFSYPQLSVTATNPSVGPNGSPAPTSSNEIGFIDGSGNLQGVSPSNPLPVTVTSGPNPQDINLFEVAGAAVNVGTGADGAGTQRVAVSSTSIAPVLSSINSFSAKSASAFINVPFDEAVITYVGATTQIDTVTYKLATVTVNTLTLSYDGSNRLVGVVKT